MVYVSAVGTFLIFGILAEQHYFARSVSPSNAEHVDARRASAASQSGESTVSTVATNQQSSNLPSPGVAVKSKPDIREAQLSSDPLGGGASYAGILFPVSPSVENMCHGFSKCDEIHDKLSKFAQEPRDTSWAATMEAEIQDNVASFGPSTYSIRDLECRSSLCVVEVESLFGTYPSPRYGTPLYSALDAGVDTIWGYEKDESGARVTVTLKIFARK